MKLCSNCKSYYKLCNPLDIEFDGDFDQSKAENCFMYNPIVVSLSEFFQVGQTAFEIVFNRKNGEPKIYIRRIYISEILFDRKKKELFYYDGQLDHWINIFSGYLFGTYEEAKRALENVKRGKGLDPKYIDM